MSTSPKILVTSAVGNTGLHVTQQLLAKGYSVRAFIRQHDQRTEQLKQRGADIFIGNQYSLEDMSQAMQGIERAYQCAPTAANGLHFNAAFTIAAAENKIKHIVSLGQWLTSISHPSQYTRDVYMGEALNRLNSDITLTQVNPGWFAQNYLMVLAPAAHLGLFTMPLGDGDQKKNAPPSNEDIASVVVAALLNPEDHAGKIYRPTGPELLSPNEIAAAMGRALGRRVRYMDSSEKMMTKALRAQPPSNYSEANVSQLALYAEEYRRGTFAINAPTSDVEHVTGRTPERFESIVARYVADSPELQPSFAKRLGALAGLVRIMFTPALDLQRVKAEKEHIVLNAPRFSQDSDEWMRTHSPKVHPLHSEQAA